MIDRMADYAAKHGPRPWLKPGGKSLSGDGKHSPALRVVVAADTAKELRRRAEKSRMSLSKYLRKMIERELAKPAA
jgi:hypothetical protein